jgi:hypothetical protein
MRCMCTSARHIYACISATRLPAAPASCAVLRKQKQPCSSRTVTICGRCLWVGADTMLLIFLQDIRVAMSLLTAMPTVNLQLWVQLSRAAGWHGHWLLARECANAALGALPADKRDLLAVTAATEVPDLGAQGWYWLSVAEMQQGQVCCWWSRTQSQLQLGSCHCQLGPYWAPMPITLKTN